MAQFARPDSDITTTGWNCSSGSDFYALIDEVTPSDSDYVYTDAMGTDPLEVGLSDVTDPESSVDHTFRVRAKAANASKGGEKLNIYLMENGTQRAYYQATLARDTYNTFAYTLTGTEADSISNYANLRLKFVFVPGTGGNDEGHVSWAEFEVPDAAGQTYYQNVGQGAISPVGTLAKKGFVNAGGHSMVIAGTLAKKGFVNAGGHSMAIAGTLVKKGFVDVGGHSMVIAGTLATVRTVCIDVGGYAMTITGTLVKKGFVNTGGHAMTIVGTLIKKGFKDCGGHSMTITGDCDPKAVIGQIVGEGAVAIAGTLQTVLIRGCAVGGGVVNIVGTLLKKTSISVGGGIVSPVGTLQAVLLILQNVGQGAVSIVGNCVGQFKSGGVALNLVIWRYVSYIAQSLLGLVTKHKSLDDIDLD